VRRRTSVSLVVTAALIAACGGGEEPSVTVVTKEVPAYGEVLATQDGKLLYVLTSDPKGGSNCADACAKEWPPLVGEPAAGDKVEGSKLKTFEREDGQTQVLYADRALYTYTGDELAGPGTKAQGGTWFFVAPDGEPVDSTQAGGY
jgi:predicted lipoprotein with Yx(FWY)xxD motif